MSGVSNRKFLYFKLYINNLSNANSQITQLYNNLQFAHLTKGLDLNVAIEQRVYCETSSLIVGSLKNRPLSISDGEAIVIWLPSSVSNKYGCQLFLHTSEDAQSAYLRHMYNTKWSGWRKITLS